MSNRFWIALWLLLAPLLVGCEGCRNQDVQPEKPATEEAFSRPNIVVHPGTESGQMEAASVEPTSFVKPGHYFSASVEMRSNREDYRGELRVTAAARKRQDSADLMGTDIESEIAAERPAILPKGRTKSLDIRLIAPQRNSQEFRGCTLQPRFVSRSDGIFVQGTRQTVNFLNGEEFFFVVLTKRNSQFGRVRTADWLRPIYNQMDSEVVRSSNYRLAFPEASGVLPLPETMLDMTSTAVVLWDDLPPSDLTPQQLDAMIDWVHFGGRLIVNGPVGESLTRSAFAPYLPLYGTQNIELDGEQLAKLMETWSVRGDTSVQQLIKKIQNTSSLAGVDGQLKQGARSVDDTYDLVASLTVGRGEVVMTRFDLTAGWVTEWDSADSFINGVLMGRPGRRTVRRNEDGFDIYEQKFLTSAERQSVNSQVRIASRDAILREVDQSEGELDSPEQIWWNDKYSQHDPINGPAAWRGDRSDLGGLVKVILNEESGITVPDSAFVAKCLLVYLCILIPLNYFIFRVLGRLEWAWYVMPVIAILGAGIIARAAQLDIGFARSQTQIGVLELQGSHPRAHLTRYSSIYNSLSTNYELEFADGQAAAFPTESTDDSEPMMLRSGYADGPILSGFNVPSNKVRFLQTEQLVDIGGGIDYSNDQLTNNSDLDINDVFVVRHTSEGAFEVAKVGDLSIGEQADLTFIAQPKVIEPGLPLGMSRILSALGGSGSIPNGEIRMVGRIDGIIPGMEIRPSTAQSNGQTAVLVHLQHPQRPEPGRDANLRKAIVKK